MIVYQHVKANHPIPLSVESTLHTWRLKTIKFFHFLLAIHTISIHSTQDLTQELPFIHWLLQTVRPTHGWIIARWVLQRPLPI